ncbi:type II toxin-antitoxin system VapC family toxin [Desulfonema magnum]|uniref:PIN domain-containing protein n=1 Tax=Desulfonema magnum TaxID=45655 RepID=A0A975BKC1_9BACT|nr:type II toxin-antitoxin system VapC family toxin [Desulfonema magnum]QTA87304.1 PIN domain-containing protein [Desulfonema magnum]
MSGMLVDSNVILDIFENNPKWADWSESVLHRHSMIHTLYINPVIYSEISVGFKRIEELEEAIAGCEFQILQIPREALFRAGKAFFEYRRRGGNKISPLPDFYIGAHAVVTGMSLITRDISRFRSYFPSVRLITPEQT